LTDKQKEAWKRWHGDEEFKIGRQYWKSGWLTKAPENFFGMSRKRWFQLRHWVCYYYPEEQDDFNYPEWPSSYVHQEEDKSLLDRLPGLPDLSLPSLPSLPSLSMPDLSMPDISMPSLSMPSISLSAPSLGKINMPKRKEHYPEGPFGRFLCYNGAKIKRSGKKLTISNTNQLGIFKGDTESKDKRKFELTAEDEEEAESWYKSFVWGGMDEEK